LTRYTTPHLTPLTLLATLDSSSMNILTFSDQISAISKACYYLIRQLRCIRPYLDSNTARAIATSIVHSKLDYCNSLYYNLPKSQITRLQQIQNSLDRVVVKTPNCCHITPILHSLHWLKITERIEYKLLSLTSKVLTTSQPTNLGLYYSRAYNSGIGLLSLAMLYINLTALNSYR